MITNTGKNILAKYLIGQAPGYASYIAVGCGPKPLASDAILTNEQITDFKNKTKLDFEMFRVPITSRGFVNENGVSKVVLTAELPSEERYEITEVGVFSAGSNPLAGSSDSRPIYTFSQTETWEYHNPSSATSIQTVYEPLDTNNDNVITGSYLVTNNGVSTLVELPVFQTNADNRTLTNIDRITRNERCRFLNNIVAIRGDSSELMVTAGHLDPEAGSSHIHLTGSNLDLNKNSPLDEIKLAFSVINKDGSSTVDPDTVRILLEFGSSDVHNEVGAQFARFEINIDNGTSSGQQDFATNRYIVATKQLQELYKSSGFTWSTVDVVKVYASVIKDGVPSENFYVCLDAVRLENNTSSNPLYGMTGYSAIKNVDSRPVVKAANTTNFIEFRFAMDVQ